MTSSAVSARLRIADAVHEIKELEQRVWNGRGSIDPGPALFQGLEDDDAVFEINAIGGERERLEDATSRMGEHRAERSHLAGAVSAVDRNAWRSTDVRYFRCPVRS